MARSIWSGSITFGLVTIPVKLYTAVSDRRLPLHLLHEKDGEPVHYKRVCEKGHELEWDDIVKGYEFEKGKWVTFTDEELGALDTESVKTVDIVNFSPADQIDPVLYDKTYYVSPQEGGTKAYRLLADAMEAEELVGVCKVAIREKEHLAAVRLKDGRLVLQTMHWPDEVREAQKEKHESKRVQVRDSEVKMARQLVQQLTADFDPDQFEDDYARALEDLARRKIEGEEITEVEVEEEPSKVVDLMDALRQSVEAARSGKTPKKKRGKTTKAATKGASKLAPDDDLEQLSKDELIERARELDVEGRSSMNKRELIRAIGKAS
jgi:DNA end-binding protein Ku